jgi:hypothetical protein
MQRYTVHYISKLLYIFRVIPPLIIRSANNCIYSICYLSYLYCYLPLSWKWWNRFECAVGGVHHPQRTQTNTRVWLEPRTFPDGWLKEKKNSSLTGGRNQNFQFIENRYFGCVIPVLLTSHFIFLFQSSNFVPVFIECLTENYRFLHFEIKGSQNASRCHRSRTVLTFLQSFKQRVISYFSQALFNP